MGKPEKIIVLSGKGGTGKTMLTASLALLFHDKIIADTDVDASNLHILLDPDNISSHPFSGRPFAEIDSTRCINCGICREKCRFNAIRIINGSHTVSDLSCEGCTLCTLVCPENAIEMKSRSAGHWFSSNTKHGSFIHARLDPGAENSGNLVSIVKEQSERQAVSEAAEFVLADGPPGIGCMAISALSGSDLAVIVTEPSLAAISDLKRILTLTAHFRLQSGIVINKWDINPELTADLERFAEKEKIALLGKIPHSHCILTEISKNNIPVLNCDDLQGPVSEIYQNILMRLNRAD